MSDASSEFMQPAPIDIRVPVYRKDFANSATGEVRKKLDREIRNDYIRLLGVKTHAPEWWQGYLRLVRAAEEASERHHRIYRESTRQAFLKARAALENHQLYQLVIRLDRNFDTHLKEAVRVAKELGKPYEEIPPDFSQAVERLLREAETGYRVPSEEKKAA
jgi:hypothetical protein